MRERHRSGVGSWNGQNGDRRNQGGGVEQRVAIGDAAQSAMLAMMLRRRPPVVTCIGAGVTERTGDQHAGLRTVSGDGVVRNLRARDQGLEEKKASDRARDQFACRLFRRRQDLAHPVIDTPFEFYRSIRWKGGQKKFFRCRSNDTPFELE